MAEEETYSKISRKGGEAAESNALLQKLKNTISKAVQNKVHGILHDVLKFSDNDKLYLYLQLPSGPSTAEKSSLDLSTLSTAEHMHACNWIRNHLEEHTDTCLPKQDVYDAYKRYCDNLCCRPLSAANFGKIIREIFPNIKARRLGGRGQSKYCYSGIRRKTVVSMPPLPSLDLKITDNVEMSDLVQVHNKEVVDAACTLICHWAEKILKRSFNNVVEVAQFLLQQHIISPRSTSAELVMSLMASDSTESRKRGPRHQPASSRNGMSESMEEATDTLVQNKKEGTTKPTSSQPAEQKKNVEAQKSLSSPQVNALVARLPTILPRASLGEKLVTCCPSVRSPELRTSPVGMHVKVASLPLPSGTASAVHLPRENGSRLISQQAAVSQVNMILPSIPRGFSFPISELQAPPKEGDSNVMSNEAILQNRQDLPKNRGAKRSSDPSSAAGVPVVKRKRGRPRKVTSEENVVASGISLVPEHAEKSNSIVQKERPKGQLAMTEIIKVTIGEEFLHKIAASPERGTNLETVSLKVKQGHVTPPSPTAIAANNMERETMEGFEKTPAQQRSSEQSMEKSTKNEASSEICQELHNSEVIKEEPAADQAHAKDMAALTGHLSVPEQGISLVSVMQDCRQSGKERLKDRTPAIRK